MYDLGCDAPLPLPANPPQLRAMPAVASESEGRGGLEHHPELMEWLGLDESVVRTHRLRAQYAPSVWTMGSVWVIAVAVAVLLCTLAGAP